MSLAPLAPFFASLRMTIAGRVSQNRQRQLLKSSGKTNLGFLMRVLHALFIALLTAVGGCILQSFSIEEHATISHGQLA